MISAWSNDEKRQVYWRPDVELNECLLLTDDDATELFHAFKNRGDSTTRRIVAGWLRKHDDRKGHRTSPTYWYAEE